MYVYMYVCLVGVILLKLKTNNLPRMFLRRLIKKKKRSLSLVDSSYYIDSWIIGTRGFSRVPAHGRVSSEHKKFKYEKRTFKMTWVIVEKLKRNYWNICWSTCFLLLLFQIYTDSRFLNFPLKPHLQYFHSQEKY